MSYQLVIAEKPSVARSIAGVIGADKKQDGYMEGNGYLVSWCIGHLVSLADAGTYDERFKKWRYDDLPILPQEWQYIIPDDKKKQFDTLRSLMERPDVTGLVCATDAGREGELIFRFVYQMAGCKKPFQRLWISSMEDAAIKDGFAHLKPGTDYDNLYQSALCRAQADWLVGINATRLFSILYHKTLTVGRVQTPTLKMLVDREAKISSFQKEKYHIVQIAAGGMEAASERMRNADDAKALKAACETAQAVCVSVTREKKTEQPPRLYDLTTLQREANRLFGFTAKQTLDYAQQLYEKKLLTYPRTDSQYLTDDMLPTAESLVSGLWPLLPFATGLDLSPQFGRVLNSKKVSDHHAIVPTMEFVQKGFDGLAEGEKKLLSLVCCKLLCAVAAPHVYEAVTATFTCAGNTFTAKGKTILTPGWKELDRRFKASFKTDADDTAPEPAEEPEEPQQEPYVISSPTVDRGTVDGVTYVPWDGVVEHLFFHPIVAYPELAFDGDSQADGIDDWMVTVDEYDKILQSVYDRGYVLVDINDVWSESTDANGQPVMVRNTLYIPEGKKPLIFSYDDVNYYDYMLKDGFTYKLILGEDGLIWSYGLDPQGNEVISQDLDAVTILDKFVREHPDFSPFGAKGSLSLTGYQGILGYRTNTDTKVWNDELEANRLKECEAVKPIIAELKRTGWTFGSHTWGHINLASSSLERVQADTKRWMDEVGSLIGPTPILYYPHGARPDGDDVKQTGPIFKYLQEQGFRVFASVGISSYSKIKTDICAVICDRLHPDGTTLRGSDKVIGWYSQFYDARDIIDLDVRPNRGVKWTPKSAS